MPYSVEPWARLPKFFLVLEGRFINKDGDPAKMGDVTGKGEGQRSQNWEERAHCREVGMVKGGRGLEPSISESRLPLATEAV